MAMKCPNCGLDNSYSARFCPACGDPLIVKDEAFDTCDECKAAVPFDANFCPQCGIEFEESGGVAHRPPAGRSRNGTTSTKCAKCGFENYPDSRKCANCGTPFDRTPTSAEDLAHPSPRTHYQLTKEEREERGRVSLLLYAGAGLIAFSGLCDALLVNAQLGGQVPPSIVYYAMAILIVGMALVIVGFARQAKRMLR
jgi:predicted amidophosphoribosyltransferase